MVAAMRQNMNGIKMEMNFLSYAQSNQVKSFINSSYPINVKTAEPIGPKFFVGLHGTTGKVYE